MRRAVATGALLVLVACGGPAEPGSEPGGVDAETATAVDGPTPGSTEVATPEPTEAGTPPPEPTRDPLADLVEGIEVAPPADQGPVLGADMGWPQCPPGMGIPEKRSSGQPLPVDEARYVILGLTNGPGFTPNPCLADQVAFVRDRGALISAYSVASFPSLDQVARHGQDGPYDGAGEMGALANTGYQQALFNVRSMQGTGLETPVVWIDVEPVPDFEWSGDLAANAAVVAGIARGYEDAGYRIGVYSTPLLWDGVVGDLELGVPEWRAAGQTSAEEALSRCGEEWVIQGGEAVLGQWVEADRDMNLTCPGVSADLSLWFHQY